MPDNRITPTGVVESSFELLRAKDRAGRTWRDREALFKGLSAIAPMSHRAAEVVIDAVADATCGLEPGHTVSVAGFRYTLKGSLDDGYSSVRIEDGQGNGGWTLERSSHMRRHHFAVTRRDGEVPRMLVSGSLVDAKPSAPHRILSANHSPETFRDLTRLATALSAGRVRGERKAFLSDPIAPVLTLDGGVPGEHARRLHRMLYEDAARRAMEWVGPLFERVAKLYAQEGFWWGVEAARWSLRDDSRFPEFGHPTNLSCLLVHPDRNSVAMLFRDAQPYLETETYIVWREGGMSRRLCLLPVEEGSLGDIEEFLQSGGVPALTFDPETGDVRATERALSSNVLQAFCDHVGEAWTVMADLPLYAEQNDRPMATDDFSEFGRIAPWTARGRRIAAEAAGAYATDKKEPPAP